jgi:hypothetical protein
MGALDDAIREHLELKRRHGASDEELTRAETEALGPARREPGAEPLDALGDPLPPPDPAEGASVGEDREAAPRPPGGDHLITDPPPPPAPPAPGLEAQPPPVAEPDVPPVEPHPVEPVAEHAPPPEPDPTEPAPPHDHLDQAPPPGTPKPHGDPVLDHEEPPAELDASAYKAAAEPPTDPDRQRTAILDDPLDELAPRDQAPVHHEPGPDEPPAPARPAGATAPPGPDEDVLEETPDFLQETPEHDRLWFEQKPPRDFDFDD